MKGLRNLEGAIQF